MLAALRLLPAKLWGYLAAAGLFLLAISRIYAAGDRNAQARGVRTQLGNVEKANEVDRDVSRLGDGGAADKLRDQWSRD